MAAEPSNNGLEFNLATILNILWRRRLVVLGLPILGLVLGLLYGTFGTKRWSATATVRPGITAFSPEGAPHRQWQLKDITTWYDKMLYLQELNESLGLPANARTVISTEFIATGLTNLAGGEVVTLWTTATNPELAAAIIDTSISLFKEYAESDTLSNQIKLTRDGLNLRIGTLKTQLKAVDQKEASLNLQLEVARADSLLVASLDRELGIELEKLSERQEFCRSRLRGLRSVYGKVDNDLADLDKILESVTAHNKRETLDPETIPGWARRDAVLDSGDVFDNLVDVRLRIQQQLDMNLAQQDSFAYELELSTLNHAKLSMKRVATVRLRTRDAAMKIGDLQLQRDYQLPLERGELRNDIEALKVQRANLTALQKIGRTIVSDRPVRPRRARATAILLFLGLVGGLVLGFAWDYVDAHRREIFRK